MEVSLVIMAAGMGSRFGGLKQIAPVGQNGEIIADYSIYDAKRAGFSKVVFVIKKEIEEVFRSQVYNRLSKEIKCELVFQEIDDLPEGFSVPPGREKPWGTGQAVLACKNAVSGPFAVINADDFYGAGAYEQLYSYLTKGSGGYCMAGYILKNTVSENGYVSRGVCRTDENGSLLDVEELTKIVKTPDGIKYTNDEKNYFDLPEDTIVSMNAWGFMPDLFTELEARFPLFLEKGMGNLKSEFLLPSVVRELIHENKATVKVLPAKDKWYGFTYKEDEQTVKDAIKAMTDAGAYPEKLWQ